MLTGHIARSSTWSVAKPSEAFPSGSPQSFDTALGWRFPNPRLAARFPLESMGETAENVAVRHRVPRQQTDQVGLPPPKRAPPAPPAGRRGPGPEVARAGGLARAAGLWRLDGRWRPVVPPRVEPVTLRE